MTIREQRAMATANALKESVAVNDEAALMHMRAAQKHLRKSRELAARLEELQRQRRGRAHAQERAA